MMIRLDHKIMARELQRHLRCDGHRHSRTVLRSHVIGMRGISC